MKTDRPANTDDGGILRKTLKEETDKNMALTVSTNDMRDAMVQAQIQSAHAQGPQHAARSADAGRRPGGPAPRGQAAAAVGRRWPAAANPPPDNLEGTVRQADGNLVTISLGSDAGLTRGQSSRSSASARTRSYIGTHPHRRGHANAGGRPGDRPDCHADPGQRPRGQPNHGRALIPQGELDRRFKLPASQGRVSIMARSRRIG